MFDNGLPGYDAWKTACPDYGWEHEPEFECHQCEDTGYEIDEGGRVDPCRYCCEPCDLDDAYARTDIDFIYTAKEH